MKAFEPGETVVAFTGHTGLVLSQAELGAVRTRLKEGRRPGRFFAPGCCTIPDYVTQVPVLFEDGTYDVMRGMNLRRHPGPSMERQETLRRLLGGQ
jgi:hypothetical protein